MRLYPELRKYPAHERHAALERARAGAFDIFECVGLLAAAVIVTALTRYSSAGLSPVAMLGVAGTSFFLALALLGVFGGPFLLRRTRRHLKSQLLERAESR